MSFLDRQVDRFIRYIRDDPKHQPPLPIGEPANDPTYWRWYVVPRNRFFNAYLHNFRKDDAHDLHDHRMINITIVLQKGYFEERYTQKPYDGMSRLPETSRRLLKTYSVLVRFPSTPHRVVLERDEEGNPIPCWSLFIGFPHWRNWGFWCPGKGKGAFWRPHEDYAQASDPTKLGYGQKGVGCGD